MSENVKKTTGTKTTKRVATAKKPVAAKPAEQPKKVGFLAKMIDGAKHRYIQIRASKAGRVVIRVTKAAALGLGAYGSYRLGQKSVKPETVYIESGSTEAQEPAEAETKVEEPAENDIQEYD